MSGVEEVKREAQEAEEILKHGEYNMSEIESILVFEDAIHPSLDRGLDPIHVQLAPYLSTE